MKTPEERNILLDKAKFQLMMDPNTVFYTSILFQLEFKWDDTIPTAATNGRHILFSPRFFDTLTQDERIGVLLHEVLHVALQHITRGIGHEDPEANNAMNYVANLILTDANFKLPKGCLLDQRFRDMAYEEVYKILMDERKQNQANNSGNGQGIPCTPTGTVPGIGKDVLPPADKAEASQIEAEIADMVLKATIQAQQVNAWGSIPGAVLIELDKTINPKLPWEVIFQNYMNRFAKDDYTWRRPNRRYLPNLIMPSAYSEAVDNVVFAVDCSCSVEDHEFGFFVQEVEVVQQTLHPELITLIDFDTEIHEIHEITQSTDVMRDIKFTGRGGTDIHPVLEWACENEPEVLIIFTDGWFDPPIVDKFPDCSVVWVIHNNPDFTTEYGEVIHYEI